MPDALLSLDGNILLWIQEYLRSDVLTPVVIFITRLGNAGFIWIVLSLALLIPEKTRQVGLMCMVALLLMLVLNNMLLKNLVARTRPYEVVSGLVPLVPKLHDFSFPSGHTASAFSVASVVFRKLPGRFGATILILAILMGFSRLYVGVHYPTDVIFAAFEGIFIGGLAERIVDSAAEEQEKKIA